ncbi:MAG: Hydroxyacylglutathione hydrolase [Methanocella sp. PtaU1.Bin125]|nr:MAG: Hydroxyacylglutathione hydrolase [Methanocella sp. PtaU1.Bin125]
MPSTIIPASTGFSNSYILRGDRAVVIDAGLMGKEKKILAALDANGIPRGNVSLIIITHCHGDHYASVKALKEALDVPGANVGVMAGWPDARYMETGDSAPVVPVSLTGRIMSLFTGAKAPPCKADLIVKEDMDLRAYGVDARVLTTPGHTTGSLSVLASDGSCAIGDMFASLFMKNRVRMAPFAEDPALIGPGLKKLVDNGAKRLYPGHGNGWDVEAVVNAFEAYKK